MTHPFQSRFLYAALFLLKLIDHRCIRTEEAQIHLFSFFIAERLLYGQAMVHRTKCKGKLADGWRMACTLWQKPSSRTVTRQEALLWMSLRFATSFPLCLPCNNISFYCLEYDFGMQLMTSLVSRNRCTAQLSKFIIFKDSERFIGKHFLYLLSVNFVCLWVVWDNRLTNDPFLSLFFGKEVFSKSNVSLTDRAGPVRRSGGRLGSRLLAQRTAVNVAAHIVNMREVWWLARRSLAWGPKRR